MIEALTVLWTVMAIVLVILGGVILVMTYIDVYGEPDKEERKTIRVGWLMIISAFTLPVAAPIATYKLLTGPVKRSLGHAFGKTKELV